MENKDKLIALYIRGREEQEIEEQKNRLKKYCEKSEIKMFKFYIDKGVSGLDKNRIALKRLEKDIEDEKIKLIITEHMGKIYRDMENLIKFHEKCMESNIKIYTLDGANVNKESDILKLLKEDKNIQKLRERKVKLIKNKEINIDKEDYE